MASRMMTGAAVAVLLIGVLTNKAAAYETPTHSAISERAINRSVLMVDPSLLADLGLTISLDAPAFPGEVPESETAPMPDSTINVPRAPIRRLIKSGAVLEDRAINSLHHFYDPVNGGRGLTLGRGQRKITAGIASPNWILDTGVGISISKLMGQRFSYPDSMKYFYRALTANQLSERNSNWGLMFRGLGHLIHHIQDMAQPQHVRNDQHCDGTVSHFCFSLNNPSHFEKYTDLNRERILAATSTYPLPDFPLMRQFWDNPAGTGLAEYVQSNFVSQGTNFSLDKTGTLVRHTDYLSPAPFPGASSTAEQLAVALQQASLAPGEADRIMQGLDCQAPHMCMLEFIPTLISDTAAGQQSQINPRASTLSFLDDELQTNNSPQPFVTYNRLNFHAAYPFLFSRAIAYSAGMINHFFRGRLSIKEIVFKADNQAQITVTNKSSPGINMTGGHFEMFYDSMRNGRRSIRQLNLMSGGLPLFTGSNVTLSMNIPLDVNTSIERPYLLVFNALDGRIGAEAGIAAVAFDVAVTGRVEHLSQGASECPNRTYGVSIIFPQQPPGKGQVLLQGELSRSVFDFSTFASGFDYKRGNAVWRHGFDTEMDVYRYEVTYRYQDSDADPCTSPGLGGWIEGERVKVIRR